MTSSGTEPNGWELKRGLDQLRADMREDMTDLKTDVAGVAAKIEAMDSRYVTHLAGVVRRVENVEKASEKKSDRSMTILLALGVCALSSMVSIGIAVSQAVGR
jgi:hypothetical protein